MFVFMTKTFSTIFLPFKCTPNIWLETLIFCFSDFQLFRHGDRTPADAYPTDEYQEKYWPQGFGQLTQVQ